MRLINTSTQELVSFPSHSPPPYAILSHRWGDSEIVFEDFVEGKLSNSGKRKLESYQKLQGTCREAVGDGLQWCWIDNCCIDKRHSAELQESINSMFNWYKAAATCYVHLDVHFGRSVYETLKSSSWIKRGWTLQELLAPERLHIFDKGWSHIGCKSELMVPLSEASGIPAEALADNRNIQNYSIAQRMSWASLRETYIPEDIAYCLLGIFDVYMPMLYGEGRLCAFHRLQEEIIKKSNDPTIFIWRHTDPEKPIHSILADEPSFFLDSHDVIIDDSPHSVDTYPFSMTNMGLKIKASILEIPLFDFPSEIVNEPYIVLFRCNFKKKQSFRERIGIIVETVQEFGENVFARTHTGQLVRSQHNPETPVKIFISSEKRFPERYYQLKPVTTGPEKVVLLDLEVPIDDSTGDSIFSQIKDDNPTWQERELYISGERIPGEWNPLGWTKIIYPKGENFDRPNIMVIQSQDRIFGICIEISTDNNGRFWFLEEKDINPIQLKEMGPFKLTEKFIENGDEIGFPYNKKGIGISVTRGPPTKQGYAMAFIRAQEQNEI